MRNSTPPTMPSLWRDEPATVRPMLASIGSASLESSLLAYEPKYDGIRALILITPPSTQPRRQSAPRVRIWSRLGNEKTGQFPDIVAALEQWAGALDRDVIVDGEIVALDLDGHPSGFQNLQGRIHLKAPAVARDEHAPCPAPLAFIAFDLLREGNEDLRPMPLRDRRARLEQLFARAHAHDRVRLSEQVVGDGRAMMARAQAHAWEGVIAKRLDSRYHTGRRTPDWCKLKLVRHQTCVVGGWTDPRGSRPFFGALLLGVHDEAGRLQYIGHTGAGFDDAELGRIRNRLRAVQATSPPFATTPRTNERPHWVRPTLVVEVKFTEWTSDGKLRHPTYLGVRDDILAESVRKEPDAIPQQAIRRPHVRPASGGRDHHAPMTTTPEASRPVAADRAPRATVTKATVASVLEQLDAVQARGGNGVLELPEGQRIEVTNLGKVFWPRLKLTKGDLFRHYVRVAPVLLPVLAERPLVMKRFPNGVAGKPFYQHRASDRIPASVHVALVRAGSEARQHVIGGSLASLLYTVQLASISQDPWFSRVGSEELIDHVALDLDPPEGLPFARVLDVARWVHDELETLRAPGFPKTSGAGGLHIYVPMPPQTPYEAGLLFAQIVATMVSRKHPKAATVERSIAARGRRVYVDYLQNVQGKTLASAYSARANDFAGVSTPLTWDEVASGVSPKDFTIRSFAARLEEVGDQWAALRRAKGANLKAVMKYAEPDATV